jgi:TRAP-type C4-dicarboxylate transport system substrate-binding protein
MKKAGKCFGLLLGGLIMTLSAVTTGSAETIELKMAHFMSPMHVQHQQSFVPFAQEVEKLTGGKVKIKIFPGGALGGAPELADSVKTGIADIAFIVPSYTTGRFPRTSAFDLPFIFNNAVQAAEVLYEVYDKYLAEDFKDYKVLWLYSCDTGQLHSVNKPIRKLDDLKGMKMRAPSSYMSEALKLLGANPVSMPLSELSMALDKRVIDGMLSPNTSLTDFKLTEIIKYTTQVDFYISPMAVIMNKEKYNSLPDYAKKALDQASGKKWGLRAAKIYDDYAKTSLKSLSDSGKIKVYRLTPEEKKKCLEKVKKMETDWVVKNTAKGIPAQELLDKLHLLVAGIK